MVVLPTSARMYSLPAGLQLAAFFVFSKFAATSGDAFDGAIPSPIVEDGTPFGISPHDRHNSYSVNPPSLAPSRLPWRK